MAACCGTLAVVACVLVVLLVIGGAVAHLARPAPTRPGRRPRSTRNDPNPGVTTAALNDRANTALVELDDAMRTSERELAMARDQYGPRGHRRPSTPR